MFASFSLKHIWYFLCVALIVAFPETYIQRELRGGSSGGGGGSSGGSSRSTRKSKNSDSSNACVETNVTYINADNSTSWKMTEDCKSSGGMIVGVVIGGLFLIGGIFYFFRYFYGKNHLQTRLQGCEKACHPLIKTSGTEMYNKGNRSYASNWLCDKCNARSDSRPDIPLYRCEGCAVDYCGRCEQTRSASSGNVEMAGAGSGRNMRTVMPIN